MEIYTYRCVDGIVRTRCRRHIARRGPYAPLARDALLDVRPGDRADCYACTWEADHRVPSVQRSTPSPLEEGGG